MSTTGQLCRVCTLVRIATLVEASISCRRRTRATSCFSRIMLHTELDAQCDELRGRARRSNVDRSMYCQLSPTEDGPVYYSERLPLSS